MDELIYSSDNNRDEFILNSNLKIKYFLNRNKLLKYNILYLNINSIKNKLYDLEDLIGNLGEIHIIALTEIRIFSEQNQYYNLNNYNAFFNNRFDGDGGVALYIHRSLDSVLLDSTCVNNVHRLVVNIPQISINVAVL